MINGNLPEEMSAVALGIFDGVHLGHRAVISRAVEIAAVNGLQPSVFTFDTASVTSKERNDFLIPGNIKHLLIEEMGVKKILSLTFDSVKDYSAEEFVEKILYRQLGSVYAVCGEDFRFGRNAEGNVDTLRKLGKKYGMEVETVPDVMTDKGERISSTMIRKLLLEGGIKEANKLLGRRFSFKRPIEYGHQIGRTLDFPTINQYFEKGQAVVRYGVYASCTEIKGKEYPSVTNIGMKPTVANTDVPVAETHIIGFDGDVYGDEARVTLIDFIRPEKKFSSIYELKNQIAEDIKAAESY